jgi:cytochrome c553
MLFLQGGWSQLDDKDLHAVAAFVKALPPVAHKVPDAAPAPSAPQAAR